MVFALRQKLFHCPQNLSLLLAVWLILLLALAPCIGKEADFGWHGDWFWARFVSDGQAQEAGKVASWATCHGAVESNDFIFTFPLREAVASTRS